jgi:hypothetical protein
MTDKPVPKKRGRPKKTPSNAEVKLPEVIYKFPDKKAGGLKGQITTGTIFIGDAGFFADNPQKYPEGIIPNDPTNPFKDWDKFSATHENDCNLDLPGSFNGDLPGRGVVIQTNMLNGSYSVEKENCPMTGKLLSIKVIFRD